ncbi:MAG: helix-turn-helix transcriptional regulator [Myxacorys chilensis ATA2-1-KO14]|nr:helix-turn-helix transcriptional regulator [Myxacorys chilensis ATA2-1-KO14]
MNRIQEFGKEKGIPSANKFWQKTGLPRATAFRLWRDRNIYPDRATVEAICRTLNAQPGDFLVFIADGESIGESEALSVKA